jgi:hypothetical protein
MVVFFFFSFFFSLVVVVVAAAVDDSPGIIKDLSIYDRFPLPPFSFSTPVPHQCQRPCVIMIWSRSEEMMVIIPLFFFFFFFFFL